MNKLIKFKNQFEMRTKLKNKLNFFFGLKLFHENYFVLNDL